jgi:hypothetical protein
VITLPVKNFITQAKKMTIEKLGVKYLMSNNLKVAGAEFSSSRQALLLNSFMNACRKPLKKGKAQHS